MAFLVALFAALAALVGHAPSDMPPTHWAANSVTELFSVGILSGYPAPTAKPLLRQPPVKVDEAYVKKTMRRLQDKGMLVGYPYGTHSRDRFSTFDEAVRTHAIYVVLCDRSGYLRYDAGSIVEIPNIIRLISMFEPELVRIGADIPKCIRDLNDVWQGAARPFRG